YQEEIQDNLPDLYTDYYRLMQVLTNLLSNAYKYTPEGGTITLRVKQVEDRVRFEVQDTGIGLSEEGVAKLGTRYWRAEDEYTRSQPGTGLGFSITARLIEQMGSYVEIESELGKGSQFAFSVAIFQA
ncbi:MAG: ATP-binding protein, partial [Anaerolineae bacterium]|nr:ATP-binding protein [Anaerolineae bacterium]